MIYAIHYYLQESVKNVLSRSIYTSDLAEVLELFESRKSEMLDNLIYLKDVKTNSLIKIEIIDNHLVIDYILDLFDFEKEFKEKVLL